MLGPPRIAGSGETGHEPGFPLVIHNLSWVVLAISVKVACDRSSSSVTNMLGKPRVAGSGEAGDKPGLPRHFLNNSRLALAISVKVTLDMLRLR